MDPFLTPLATLIASWLADRDQGSQVQLFAARRIEVASPAWVATLGQDQVVVYRTTRARQEGARVAQAIRDGRPHKAFRASVAISSHVHHHGDLARRFNSWKRRGAEPLFTSPYVSAAAWYRQHASERVAEGDTDPVTWALVVPRDAVLWEHPRVEQTQGVLYSLLYPDSELVVDASRVQEVRWVPDELVEQVHQVTQQLGEDLIAKAGFRNAYKDRDPELAAATKASVLALQIPQLSLGRPFLERPLELPIGGVKKGQRAILVDGQVVVLTDARAIRFRERGGWDAVPLEQVSGRIEALEEDGVRLRLAGRGYQDWTEAGVGGPMDPANLSWRMIAKPLQKGERARRDDRLEIWRHNRGLIEDTLIDLQKQWHSFAAQARARGDRVGAETLERQILALEGNTEKARSPFPPWWGDKR